MLLWVYGIIFFSLLIMLVSLMLFMSSALNLAVMFVITVCISTYFFTVVVSEVMSYMLFLVYVGGLLVLLIYMIMVSSNYLTFFMARPMSFMVFICALWLSSLVILQGDSFTFKALESSGVLPLAVSSLIVLGAMLLYIFLNICSTICLGGRTLEFGLNT